VQSESSLQSPLVTILQGLATGTLGPILQSSISDENFSDEFFNQILD
jgi:hypothetical protein